MKQILLFSFLLCVVYAKAQQISIGNKYIQRTLAFDGKVWRTTKIGSSIYQKSAEIKSEEFHILFFNNKSVTISNFEQVKNPENFKNGDTSFVKIQYRPILKSSDFSQLPNLVTIRYYVVKDEKFLRKQILLQYNKADSIDRLEVERFIVNENAIGGGRGEPVFVNNKWFFGLEYPAGYSRHTNGNTPKSYGRYYDKVGNYSFINLEEKDVEPVEQKGMIRLMHFPGYTTEKFEIISKTAVAGVASNEQDVETAFMQYLTTICKQPRSFLHYNNWFEPKAKDLSGDGLINIWREFKKAIEPYGVKMQAIAVDNGWQNTKSIWDPLVKYFPNGYLDVKKLSKKLSDEGVGFGIWLSLNGYVNNIDWGIENGYHEAKRNKYFEQYGRTFSLSATKYKNEMLYKLPYIAKEANAVYFKHDFNTLNDCGQGNNHPATDRHGHEANLDATIEILLATKKAVPEIFQNLTNWVWFSPWWLMYSDYLWMLAGDDGINGNSPEISTRAMASTDRDTYIWRMFGNSKDRPLIPISRLMTHGVIKTSTGRLETKEDNLQDWMDYVVMHYGRGTLLKEWYLSPQIMTADEWKAVCTVHNWAEAHEKELNNTCFIGNRPDEGNAYGYIGWQGNKAVLIVRNTGPATQNLAVPVNSSFGYFGKMTTAFTAKVAYPYQQANFTTLIAGAKNEISLPGYATMVFEIEAGNITKQLALPKNIGFKTQAGKNEIYTSINLPIGADKRCDLLLIADSSLPQIIINGEAVKPYRSNKAIINNFADYAIEGMPSKNVKGWKMEAMNLSMYAGKKINIIYKGDAKFKAYLLTETSVKTLPAKEGKGIIWALNNNTRRQTIRLY